MKIKGFLIIESMVALFIAMLSVTLFSYVVLEGNKTKEKVEDKTDFVLAKRMMRQNNLKSVTVHGRTFRIGDKNEPKN